MPQKTAKLIHLIYGCVLAALIAVLGISLILACLGIYNSGPRPYSYESIGDAFQRVAILVYTVIAGIAGGIVLNLAIPLEHKRQKAIRDDAAAMLRFREKAGPLTGANQSSAVLQIRLRRIYCIVTAVLFAGLMVYPVIYLFIIPYLIPGYFTISNLNGDIIKAAVIALVPAAIGLLLCFICSLLVCSSLRRETDIYKKVLAANKGQAVAAPAKKDVKNKTSAYVWAIRGVIVGVAVIFIVAGIFNGGMNDVLTKAVAICTECIGLG